MRRVDDAADRRRVLVEMTPEGRERVLRFYGPLIVEGAPLLEGFSTDEIERMVAWLDAARELTDRHRDRIDGR